MKISEFIKTKQGKYISIAGIAIIFILLVLLLLFIGEKINGPKDNFVPEETLLDDPSGLPVYDTNYEEEKATTENIHPMIIGLEILKEYGFSKANQTKIINTITNYFKENYPDFSRISYLKDSFNYPEWETDNTLSNMTMVSNTGESFGVNMDLDLTTLDISVVIKKL